MLPRLRRVIDVKARNVRPKEPKTLSPAEFFDGVAEMREHLDRTGASRARAELTRMATDLVRRRADFDRWLCDGVRSALEARGVALLTTDADIVLSVGEVVRPPKRMRFGAMLSQTEPTSTDDGTLVVLQGRAGPDGAIWIERHAVIDARSIEILRALIGAAAMMLERGVRGM